MKGDLCAKEIEPLGEQGEKDGSVMESKSARLPEHSPTGRDSSNRGKGINVP